MRRFTDRSGWLPKIFLLVLPLALACGNDSTSPNGSITGTWALVTVNGSALPFTIIQLGTSKTEVASLSYTLTASNSTSGSFTSISTTRLTQNGQVTTLTSSDAGTYTVNGTAVTLVSKSGGPRVTGSWDGNRITATITNLAFVFFR